MTRKLDTLIIEPEYVSLTTESHNRTETFKITQIRRW